MKNIKNKQIIITIAVFLLGVIVGLAIFYAYTKTKDSSATSGQTISVSDNFSDNASESATKTAVSSSESAVEKESTPPGISVIDTFSKISETAKQIALDKKNKKPSEEEASSTKQATTEKDKKETASKPSNTGALSVSGSKLVDANGNAVQLKGISTHGIGWFPDYINNSFFNELSTDWNADVVRLALYTAEYNGYCTGGNKEQLKNYIKKGVEYATENNLYVIIDWHILSDGNPHTYKDEAKAFFTEMSSLYANYNNVLYEICNEPNGGTSWADIKSYAEEIIPVIRANDSDGIILVGTPTWSQYVNEAAADPIKNYSNIMYTLHFYADTHRESLRDTMKNAVSSGLPIFVTEYGICDSSGNGAINTDEANKWVQTMNSLGISYVAWNISNKNETSAIFNSSCNKTSDFSQEDLSASGKWLYEMLTGKTKLEGNNNSSSAQNNNSAAQQNNQTASSENTNSQSKQNQNSQGTNTSSAGTNNQTIQNAKLSHTLTLVNKWETNGEYFYQYTATVSNNTDKTCSSWSISIPFNGDIKLSDSWNGKYTVNGSTLSVNSVDYNGTIAPGGSTGDVGFIISGAKNLAPQ